MKRLTRSANLAGFTLLELMLAIMIFSMVLAAIYSTWMAILKGSKLGLEAAADVQRSRIAIRALEDAFVTCSMFTANIKHYAFVADTRGDMAQVVRMTARLPASFPGVGRYGDAVVRRVSFETEPGPDGNDLDLVVKQAPLLQDFERNEPYKLTLAKNVTLFQLEFWDEQKAEWLDEWANTNQMPRLVRIAIGLGQSQAFSSDPRDVVTRLVAIPSAAVPAMLQGAPAGARAFNPGLLNQPPGSVLPPGVMPPVGGIPRGRNPNQPIQPNPYGNNRSRPPVRRY